MQLRTLRVLQGDKSRTLMAVGAADSRYLRLSHQLSFSVFILDTVARHELAAGTALSANGCKAEACSTDLV